MVLYRILISAYFGALRLAALFSPKARLWVQGRRDIMPYVRREMAGQRVLWFHCSSLGEFEQGRPLIEKVRALYPTKKLLLTFFSPSGYTLRKDYPLVDYVCYLPQDTPQAVEAFLAEVQPEMVIFVKYDYWYILLQALLRRQIPVYFVSAVIKKGHYLTRWYAASFRKILRQVTHFYVQDKFSKAQFEQMGITQVTVAGDTRVDRVVTLAQNAKKYPAIQDWVGQQPVFICGSTWPADEAIIVPFFETIIRSGWKIIIAPHEVNPKNIRRLAKKLPKNQAFFSALNLDEPSDSRLQGVDVLIVDTVGHLNALYQFGQIAYVGGGFETSGLHNTLEPAAFGLPLIYGPNFSKFMEAVAFAKNGGGFVVGAWNKKSITPVETCREEFEAAWENLQNPPLRGKASQAVRSYIAENRGATEQIVSELMPVSTKKR